MHGTIAQKYGVAKPHQPIPQKACAKRNTNLWVIAEALRNRKPACWMEQSGYAGSKQPLAAPEGG
jgi:hypothetical protein